jgi:hypothetical protein
MHRITAVCKLQSSTVGSRAAATWEVWQPTKLPAPFLGYITTK